LILSEAADQTIFHHHVHIITRYKGDVPGPRGPGLPVDMEVLLARIWEGRAYETYDHGEGGMHYRLPLNQSKYAGLAFK